MQDLIARLMGEPPTVQRQSTKQLLFSSRPRLRIGFWPIRGQQEPELAMGLATVLAYLLERWPSVQIYRLFARVEGEPAKYEWRVDKSQFDVDDWELQGLDENIAIGGSFEQLDGQFVLKLEVENDLLVDADSVYSATWEAGSLGQLIAMLPKIADSIATYINAGEVNFRIPLYSLSQWREANLREMLSAAFDWELDLFLALWGKAWGDEQVLTDYKNLLTICAALDGGLGDWVAAHTAAHLLSISYADMGTSFAEQLEAFMLDIETGPIYAIVIGLALYRAGFPLQSYDLLEALAEEYPENDLMWSVLADLYWLSGDLGVAVDTFQRSIKAGATSAATYVRYAELLLALDASNVMINVGAQRTSRSGQTYVEQFVLIDPAKVKSNHLIHEATEAYEMALNLDAENIENLSLLVTQLADIQADALWDRFRRLVELDLTGDYVRNALEAMYNLDNITPAIEILTEGATGQTNRIDMRLNLAFAFLLNEQAEEARLELEQTRDMSNDVRVVAEIERLRLSASDPEFESRMGEISDLTNAGNQISAEDIEFLEDVVENAPSFSTGYILLGNAYLNWHETSNALEVLLDGQKVLPNDPDISVLLARVLWETGEAQLALDCLNKALLKHPSYVPILAMMGRFSFEIGHDEEARTFLMRAESLDSRNQVLNEVRLYVANRIGNHNTN